MLRLTADEARERIITRDFRGLYTIQCHLWTSLSDRQDATILVRVAGRSRSSCLRIRPPRIRITSTTHSKSLTHVKARPGTLLRVFIVGASARSKQPTDDQTNIPLRRTESPESKDEPVPKFSGLCWLFPDGGNAY